MRHQVADREEYGRKRRRVFSFLLLLAALYVVLLIPDGSPTVSQPEPSVVNRPFIWNQDARWDSLETSFALARSFRGDSARVLVKTSLHDLEEALSEVEAKVLPPTAPEFSMLERALFSAAPLVGVCPRYATTYVALVSRIRVAVKHQSAQWDMIDRAARETLYRLLYGGRMAVEEVILQAPADQRPPSLLTEEDEPSATPSTYLLGVSIHSGDILLSRGAVPTSALIARGNDYPGNFSHVALAYVDSLSGKLSLIEAHIEKGVAVAAAEQYLGDKKLRVLVLRLRSDLPAMRNDPLLPHRAASAMFERAHGKHIPYDFSMDCTDSTALFCSEVASVPYRSYGVKLWMGMSHISSPGLRTWLADFGARQWETQEPSDLEYDPQLRVVAEWRDPETLRKDRIDNGVTDAMLERAEQGEHLGYDWYLLPVARLMKAYSSILNLFDTVGPVPEGMSAAAALKHRFYVSRHNAVAAAVSNSAERFRHERGYEPPYWEMLRMAREVLGRM